MSDNDYAAAQMSAVQDRIAKAAQKAGRPAEQIRLIGAAKQQSPELLNHFINNGLQDVGENYLQEAIAAQNTLPNTQASWHYIGKIQSNKTATIAANFDWVHSVDRLKIASRLADQCPAQKTLNILLQVDIDDEATKGGVAISDVNALCAEVARLTGVTLRGFMVLPRARSTEQQQREPFQRVRELMMQCNNSLGLCMDTLSMGMSGDLEAAILEGSTMVRIGTDLFGPRTG